MLQPLETELKKDGLLRKPAQLDLEGDLDIVKYLVTAGFPLKDEHIERLKVGANGAEQDEFFALLLEHGAGTDSLSKAVSYYLKLKLIDEGSKSPLDALKSLVTDELVRRLLTNLRKDNNYNLREWFVIHLAGMPNVDGSADILRRPGSQPTLRQYAQFGVITLEQEAEMEEWLMDRLKLSAEDRDGIRKLRANWLFAYQKSVSKERVDEPNTVDFNRKKVSGLVSENQPLQALAYLRKLPQPTKGFFSAQVAESLLKNGLATQATQLWNEVKDEIVGKSAVSSNEFVTIVERHIPMHILMTNARELLWSLEAINRKGVEKLCQALGVSREQLVQVIYLTTYHMDDDVDRNDIVTYPSHYFTEVLHSVSRLRLDGTDSFDAKEFHYYRKFLHHAIYVAGLDAIVFPDREVLESDAEIALYLANAYGADNNKREFLHWLRISNQKNGGSSTVAILRELSGLNRK